VHIAIGSDHAGFNLKQTVMSLLCEMGHSYKDFGCHDTGAVDYPDIGKPVAEAVSQGEFDCGILICSTGVGMSIVSNKVSGIRAALCQDMFSARRAREHNNANYRRLMRNSNAERCYYYSEEDHWLKCWTE